MLASRFVVASTAALFLGATISAAIAGDRHRHHHRGDIVGGNGLPSVVHGLGTFSGAISAARVRGNGIYFAIEASRSTTITTYRAPKATIIEVSLEAPDNACSFEAGVCVIRPRN